MCGLAGTQLGQADAQAAGHQQSVDGQRATVHRREHLFGPCCAIGQRGIGHQHEELVAAISAQQVLGAQTIAHTLADVTQAGIADVVAMGIVDALEVVDVDERHAQGTPGGLDDGDLLLEPPFDGATAQHTGQRVGARLAAGVVAVAPQLQQLVRQPDREQQPGERETRGQRMRQPAGASDETHQLQRLEDAHDDQREPRQQQEARRAVPLQAGNRASGEYGERRQYQQQVAQHRELAPIHRQVQDGGRAHRQGQPVQDPVDPGRLAPEVQEHAHEHVARHHAKATHDPGCPRILPEQRIQPRDAAYLPAHGRDVQRSAGERQREKRETALAHPSPEREREQREHQHGAEDHGPPGNVRKVGAMHLIPALHGDRHRYRTGRVHAQVDGRAGG